MAHDNRISYKDFILLRGIDRTASDLRVSREIVRLWAKKANVPAGANLRKFVELARMELGDADFAEFMESLMRDVFGADFPWPRAANE